MKIAILSSGSKGNSTLVESENTKILVDLGVTKTYLEEKLREIEVDPYDISAILITHTHADHIQGLKVFLKKYQPDIYVTKETLGVLQEQSINANYVLYDDKQTIINDLEVNIIKTSHDVAGSVGFVLKDKKASCVYITDTGYINNKYFDMLKNHDLYVMESNHDVEMLMNGAYPYYLKQRILGDKGHLSNDDAAYYLSEFVGNKTKTIILAHLSDDNNTYEKAQKAVSDVLKQQDKMVNNLIITKQKKRTDLIEV